MCYRLEVLWLWKTQVVYSYAYAAQWSTEQEGDSDVPRLTISALRTKTIGVRGLMLSVWVRVHRISDKWWKRAYALFCVDCTALYTIVLTEFTYVYMRNRKCSASRYCLQSRADRTSGNATGSAHYCYYSRTIWNGCSVRIPRRVLIGPPRIASTSFRVEPLVMERSDRRHVSLGSTFLHSKCWEDTGIPTQPNGKWTGSREPVELRKPKSDELIWNNEFMNGNTENLQLYEYQYTVIITLSVPQRDYTPYIQYISKRASTIAYD